MFDGSVSVDHTNAMTIKKKQNYFELAGFSVLDRLRVMDGRYVSVARCV